MPDESKAMEGKPLPSDPAMRMVRAWQLRNLKPFLGVDPAAARAEAALSGREYVLPDDVRAVAVPVLAHRLILDRRAGTDSAEELVRAVLDEVRVPAEHTPRTR